MGEFRQAGLVTDDENTDLITQVQPGSDGIALDQADMRVGEWLGSGEDGKQRIGIGHFWTIKNAGCAYPRQRLIYAAHRH